MTYIFKYFSEAFKFEIAYNMPVFFLQEEI